MNEKALAMLTLAELAGYARDFATDHPDVQAVALLSTDGLLLASAGLASESADRMAATTSSLTALALSGALHFDLGATTHVMVCYTKATLLVIAVNERCVMAVFTDSQAVGPTLYEMTRFAEAHGGAISPEVRGTLTAQARS
jgi:uncharacterized protein